MIKYIEKEMTTFDGKNAIEYRSKLQELDEYIGRYQYMVSVLSNKRNELVNEYRKLLGFDKEVNNEFKAKA